LENYKRSKEWLELSFNNIKKVCTFYKIQEYDACVFRIQLAIEQLQKSLLFLFGFQPRKSHEPSKILDSLIYNDQIQANRDVIKKTKELSSFAKIIEKEETSTRYGLIRNERLIPPQTLYDKSKAKEFLNVLSNFLIIFKDILINFSEFKKQIVVLEEYINKLKNNMQKKIK